MVSSPTEVRKAPASPPEKPADGPKIGFRPDIEGLRAIAVTMVVLNHSGLKQLTGGFVGVDVFFVISGFLITTLLVKERSKSGTISLPGFYARRAIRLLPVSALVLVATILGAWFFMPLTRFKSITTDALFSTFYGINWRLAWQGTNYFSIGAAPSPLQHLWSLAVEEQFYLVWPLLLLAVWAGVRARRRAAIALTVLAAASLAVSIMQTKGSPSWSYFGSQTRAWELAVGALVAVAANRLRRMPIALAAVLTWAGLAAIFASAYHFSALTPFPGYDALVPVLGTAAVIAGGMAATTWGAARLIGTAPFRFIGKLSYGWYLWHWPILMIWPYAFLRDATVKKNLAFAIAALGVAFVTYHLVENPVRTRPWLRAHARRGLTLGLSISASVAAFALIIGQFTPPLSYGPSVASTAAQVSAASDPMAALTQLITGSAPASRLPANLTPKLTDAAEQDPQTYPDDCTLNYGEDVQNKACIYGDPNGTKTMYLIGDSHSAQWFPALNIVAANHHWKLISLTKLACQVPTVLNYSPVLGKPDTGCFQFRQDAINRIVAARPDMVIMASNDANNGGIYEDNDPAKPLIKLPTAPYNQVWADAWKTTWDQLKSVPQRMLIQDTPYPLSPAPDCAAAHSRQLYKCSQKQSKALIEQPRRNLVAGMATQDGIQVIDPTPWFCAAGKCPIVVGDTLVYKDSSHVTVSYSTALAPVVDLALFPAGS